MMGDLGCVSSLKLANAWMTIRSNKIKTIKMIILVPIAPINLLPPVHIGIQDRFSFSNHLLHFLIEGAKDRFKAP
ncbi:MAG: hypothetical protein ACE5HY_06085, partial [Candidatus Hydrothermarchaeales archaeon]